MIRGTSLRPFDRIAFVGQMGAGKDAIAKLLPHENFKLCAGIRQVTSLLRFYDSKVEAYKFIKSIMEPSVFNSMEIKSILQVAENIPKTKKDREVLQYLGTALRRLDDLIWVRDCISGIGLSGERRVVITDVRRGVEVDALRKEGFILFYIDAGYEVRKQRCIERDGITAEQFDKDSLHEAEQEIGSLKVACDYVIDNSESSLFWAEYQLKKIYQKKEVIK